MNEWSVEKLEARAAELDAIDMATLTDADEATKLADERDAIAEEIEKRKEAAKQAAETRAAVAAGKIGSGEKSVIKEEEERTMTYESNTPEYRSLWLRDMMGQPLNAEERAAMTATSAIPTETLNKVVGRIKENKLLGKIDMMQIPGYVRIPVEQTANAASWATTSQDSQDALTYIDLTPYQLIKTVEVPATVNQMSIDAFEAYLVNQLANKIESALQNAVIVGDGSSKATGIATTISTHTGTFTRAAATKKDLLTIMGALPADFQTGAVWIMPAAVFYGEVMNISNHDSFVNVNEGFGLKLFGHDVILDDACTISNTDNIFYGDPKHYHMNLGEGVNVAKDYSVGFRSNSVVYRAVCLADGKLDMAAAFVRYDRAAN